MRNPFNLKHLSLSGFQLFLIIWAGQFVSTVGTGMTRFALIIWAYQETGSATTLALLGFFAWLPFAIISPFAGVLVDRWDRRWILIWSDLGAGLVTLLVSYLYWQGELAIWHIFLLEGVTSVFDAFQSPAATVVTSVILKKEDYARANGLRSIALDSSRIIAPMFGGALLLWIGLGGVMMIDVISVLFAIFTLIIVPLPAMLSHSENSTQEPFVSQLTYGFRYIFNRKGLLGIMLIMTGVEFCAALTYFAVLPALILERRNGDEVALGLVQAMLGGAGIIGGLIISFWGLPRRRIHAVFGFTAVSFLLGDGIFAIGQSLAAWLLAAAVASIFIPFISGGNRTIWQSKVPPGVQGRVFAVSGMFLNGIKPIGYLLAGPLADRVLGPALQTGGVLVPYLGWLVGSGPGAGIGAMFLGTAIVGATFSLSGYLFPATRNVEDDLPDYDTIEPMNTENNVSAPLIATPEEA